MRAVVSGGILLAAIQGSAPRTLPRAPFARVSRISDSACSHFLRQHEIGKVLKHPPIFQRAVDDP